MNRPLLAPNVPIDLSNCDLEPIHIPSSIQPHGMLLAALSSDLRIVYASENTESFLGVAPRYVLERTLNDILGPDAVDSIEHALGEDLYVPKDIRTYTFPLCGDQRFDVTAHRTQGLLCLELELSNENRRWDLLSSRLEGAMRTLGLAKTLPDLCAATAPVLRALTGYDRVMVYKFDADGHGEVVAEDKAPEMEPFLGLHYPATDIPAQARKLYLQQRLRTIVDINYVPVPLLGNRSFIDNTPLDMTYCGLRSVSPVHVEYLQNMGVGASLAVSLIVGGELWGMILGHHRTPRHLAPESRALCDLLGQLVSLLLGATQQSDEAADERRKEGLLEVLTTSIESGLDLEQSLLGSKDALLALVRADGAIFRIGGRLSLIGITPGPDEASSLLTAFEERMEGGTASSNEIGTILPAFSHSPRRPAAVCWLRSGPEATLSSGFAAR
jgi:light-regulated signal transduction histidine kinase (bacteriophytochrome)